MNRITKSHIQEFKSQLNIQTETESEAYELYSIYCILKSCFVEETILYNTLETLHTGMGNDWGIDGFIITVNGQLITNLQELEYIINSKMKMLVRIGLIQAKTTSHFEVSEMDKLFTGIRNIIADINSDHSIDLPVCNDKIEKLRILLKTIYDNSSLFLNGQNPELFFYYVCEGTYDQITDQKASESRINKDISESDLFSSYKFEPIGHSRLTDINRSIKNSCTVSLKISQRVTLPEVEGIDESYLCLIPFPEFKKMIFDEENKLRKGLFYDNVRDYQGQNAVNRSMIATIKYGNKSSFAVMNNGITVMTTQMAHRGDLFEIRDYQIVNGCQTCNVLAECKDEPDIDNIHLVVKLISSEKSQIINDIIIANNSQTEVKQEQLVSLLPIQKQIEEYYNAQTDYKRLYYERRSKQYRYGESNIKQESIVTIPSQIKSFVSMFLSSPDKVNGYYGSIVEDFRNKGMEVFDEKTHPCLYYLSAYSWYRLCGLISDKLIPKPAKDYPFHLLMAFRVLTEPYSYKILDSKHEAYCKHICDILYDDEKCKKFFVEASDLLKKVLSKEEYSGKKPLQNSNFTKAIISAVNVYKNGRKQAKEIGMDDAKNNQNISEPESCKVRRTGEKCPQFKVVGKIDLSSFTKNQRRKRKPRKDNL